MAKQKNQITTILIILGIVIVAFFLLRGGKVVETPIRSETVSITSYSCPSDINGDGIKDCVDSGTPLSVITPLSIIGIQEAKTHFSIEVTAKALLRDFKVMVIRAPSLDPGTTVNIGDKDRFYNALANGLSPLKTSERVNKGGSFSWDTKLCEGGIFCTPQEQGACRATRGCDSGEECIQLPSKKVCGLIAKNFESDGDIIFTAAIRGTYITTDGAEREVINTGSKAMQIKPDITAQDAFIVQVQEAVLS